jgi:hypothetical protein
MDMPSPEKADLLWENAMATESAIKSAAENVLIAYLRESKGYKNIVVDALHPGIADIYAIGSRNGLLIQIKYAITPIEPGCLSEKEITSIKARAAEKKAQPWEARIMLDESLQLKGSIEFRLLS